MDGKVLRSSYRNYSEQQILKISVQLDNSKYLFTTAKITLFEKTIFKLAVTEIVKIKLHYLRFEFREKPNFDVFFGLLAVGFYLMVGATLSLKTRFPMKFCRDLADQPDL